MSCILVGSAIISVKCRMQIFYFLHIFFVRSRVLRLFKGAAYIKVRVEILHEK